MDNKKRIPADLKAAVGKLHQLDTQAARLLWVQWDELPPLFVAGGPLQRARFEELVAQLYAYGFTPRIKITPEMSAVLAQVEADQKHAFALALWEQWQAAREPARGHWCISLLCWWAGDTAVLALLSRLPQWQKRKLDPLITTTLFGLLEIKSDLALMILCHWARFAPFLRLRRLAEDILRRMALKIDEIINMAVPTGGLDHSGRRPFIIGGRPYTLVLGDDLTFMFYDQENHPAAGFLEDTSPAFDQPWWVCQETIKLVITLQTQRLERAMMSQQRWSAAEFEAHLLAHPILWRMIRPLVWGCYDEAQQLLQCFRLDEDGRPMDIDERPLDIADYPSIGLVYPQALDPLESGRWGTALADDELWPPFPQLGRELYRLQAHELDLNELTRFKGQAFDPFTFVSTLEAQGWCRGIVVEHGVFHSHVKWFGDQQTAVLVYDKPIDISLDATLPLCQWICYFTEGRQRVWYEPAPQSDWLPLREVAAVFATEVLGDLYQAAFASKASKVH